LRSRSATAFAGSGSAGTWSMMESCAVAERRACRLTLRRERCAAE
jgi:hypothetical protein